MSYKNEDDLRAEKVKEDSPMQRALYHQDEALQTLEMNLDTLKKALRPVMRDPREVNSDAEREGTEKDPDRNSPIVADIKSKAERIQDAANAVQFLISTLEV